MYFYQQFSSQFSLYLGSHGVFRFSAMVLSQDLEIRMAGYINLSERLNLQQDGVLVRWVLVSRRRIFIDRSA
jgi:hypothetical protein